MAVVRFKFRSSAEFQPVPIPGGAASISAADLRGAVLAYTRSSSAGSRLLLSDAATGLPLGDDDGASIPVGTDVIVRRVPVDAAEGIMSDAKQGDNIGGSLFCQQFNEMIDGNILSRSPDEGSLLSHPHDEDLNLEDLNDSGEVVRAEVKALSIPSKGDSGALKSIRNKYHKINRSDVGQEATSKEFVGENSGEVYDVNGEERPSADCSTAMLHNDLPSELRCMLCTTIFKDAVMIPCCQHSFCEKCISLALGKMGRCPNCYSTKCKVADLLPNLSLRRAIEHFLETQGSVDDSSIVKYAPDGESGNQAKEASYAPSVHQREQGAHCCASGTGKDSSPVLGRSTSEKKSDGGIKIRLGSSNTAGTFVGDQATPEVVDKKMIDFQGITSSSKMLGGIMQEEGVHLAAQKMKDSGINSADGNGILVPPIRPRKQGDRTCYKCGSPNHLIRDCPAAARSHSDGAYQGVGGAYWHGSQYNHIQPYSNMYGAPGSLYGNPGLITFGTVAGPISPYVVPPYMPSIYGGIASQYAMMRMGGMPSTMLARPEFPSSNTEYMELQNSGKRHNPLYEHGERDPSFDGRPEDVKLDVSTLKSHKRKDKSDNRTPEDSYEDGSRRDRRRSSKDRAMEVHHSSHGKYGSEKMISERQDASDSADRRDRHKSSHHDGTGGDRELRTSEGTHDHSHIRKSHYHGHREGSDDAGKTAKHKTGHKAESSNSRDHRKPHKEKESSQISRHSNHKSKSDSSRDYRHKAKESSHMSHKSDDYSENRSREGGSKNDHRRHHNEKRRRLR